MLTTNCSVPVRAEVYELGDKLALPVTTRQQSASAGFINRAF